MHISEVSKHELGSECCLKECGVGQGLGSPQINILIKPVSLLYLSGSNLFNGAL